MPLTRARKRRDESSKSTSASGTTSPRPDPGDPTMRNVNTDSSSQQEPVSKRISISGKKRYRVNAPLPEEQSIDCILPESHTHALPTMTSSAATPSMTTSIPSESLAQTNKDAIVSKLTQNLQATIQYENNSSSTDQSIHHYDSSRRILTPQIEARILAAEYDYAQTVAQARQRRAIEEERIAIELAKKKLEADRSAAQVELIEGAPVRSEDDWIPRDATNYVSRRHSERSATPDNDIVREHVPNTPTRGVDAVTDEHFEVQFNRGSDTLSKQRTCNQNAVDDAIRKERRRVHSPDPHIRFEWDDAEHAPIDAIRKERRRVHSPDPLVRVGRRRACSMAPIESTSTLERNMSVPRNRRDIEPDLTEQHPSTPPHGGEVGIERHKKDDVNQLANAIKRISRPPITLPTFSGDPHEFLAFRAAYRDTTAAHNYSLAENMTRLRNALRGEAKEAVAARLYTTNAPDDIIMALERRFGRPEIIIALEIQKMRDVPRLTDAAKDLNILACRVDNCVATIKSTQNQSYLHSPELIRSIYNKMTYVLRSKYQDYVADQLCHQNNATELEILNKFLCDEADKANRVASYGSTLSSITTKRNQADRTQSTHRPSLRSGSTRRTTQRERSHACATVTRDAKHKCPHCAGQHILTHCNKLAAADVDERWNIIRKMGTCFKCLVGKHRWTSCKARPCGLDSCRRPHHRLLHQTPRRNRNTDTTTFQETIKTDTSQVGCAKTTEKHAYLKIVPVTLRGPRGKYQTFAMLDEGSTVTLLENKVADSIGAEGPTSTFNILGIGGLVKDTTHSRKVNIEIAARNSDDWHKLESTRTVDEIGLGTQTVDKSVIMNCSHLNTISNKLLYNNAKPTILIGQDNWHLIVTRELRTGQKNQPIASRTDLGWVLHGYRPADATVHFVTGHTRTTKEDDLYDLVRANYELEALGVAKHEPHIPADERALQILERETHKTSDGRYETGLLWRDDDRKMPPTEQQALNRLRSIERKMKADAEFERKYRSQMAALLDSEYAEPCTPEPQYDSVWYLPHFAVRNPRKPDKIRIVFDAAGRVNNTCLNDYLIAGPVLLQSLLGVLLRFREGAVAVTGDIREMFLRIKIREEDRDAQRFVWRDKAHDPPQHYRMKSLIFGAASSPCTALYIKNKNARVTTNDEDVITAIERDHYVDDAIMSTDDEYRAAYLVKAIIATHAAGGFEIRGWTTNRPIVLQNIDQSARGSSVSVDLASNGTTFERTLGLIWHTNQDELAFDLNMHRVPKEVASGEQKPTKRQMLSLIMSVFDPLGFLSPIMIGGKILLQHAWRTCIEWDDKINDKIYIAWKDWLLHLQNLKSLRIPRHYGTHTKSTAELHVFCDASSEAFAAVAYWLIKRTDTTNIITFVASKARVAPLRIVSIPRLELQAAILGTRLALTIIKEHRIKSSSVTYWSDSRTALTWIRSDAKRYKPFVAHRVAEIQEHTYPEQWRWVETQLNAADIATRSPPSDINFNAMHWWFSGPNFLTKDHKQWPSEEVSPPSQTNSEEETQKNNIFVTQITNSNAALPEIERFSSYIRLLRATSRVIQFVEALRRKRHTAVTEGQERATVPRHNVNKYIEVTPLHMRAAELLLIKRSQENSFGNELKQLIEGQTIHKNSNLIMLAPKIDDDGLLRSTGRINAALNIDIDVKEPVILHSNEAYTRMLISHYHHRYHHANHQTVLNEIRQRYHIIRLRSALRKITHDCQWCKVHKAVPNIPPMGDLPSARLLHHQRPFTATGIDYFGPMNVAIGRRREKRWAALFTCLTTRAVHIELASNLSADSMILALRRMIARRGTPVEIYSDNGTNFIGARRELAEAYKEIELLGEKAKELHITWRTIPPGAPNMGGAWERLVRSIKTALAVTLHERAPREELLLTLLLEAEHIVNCRPLTYVSANPEDEEALTPNHFLIGTSSGTPAPVHTTEKDLVGRATWRSAQRLADHFWRRWVKEYLPTLQQRGRPNHEKDFDVGDIVLIVDPTLPRNTWPRGRVSKLYRGPDGRVRVVNVRTAAGELLRRPVRRLVRLPTT